MISYAKLFGIRRTRKTLIQKGKKSKDDNTEITHILIGMLRRLGHC
jgi:hypothetical protein